MTFNVGIYDLEKY